MKLWLSVLVVLLPAISLRAELRTFTSAAGTTLRGELVSVIGDTVTIKKEDGTPLTLNLAAFSRIDQAWLRTHALAAPKNPQASIAPGNATRNKPFMNSLGMAFVPVRGAKVLFCVHETRRQDYAVYAAASPGLDASWTRQNYKGAPCGFEVTHPVVGVSWKDASAFCDWLSKFEGHSYRLPTDREWSVAAGLGNLEKGGPDVTPESLHEKEQTVYPWEGGYPPKNGAKDGNYPDTFLVRLIDFGLDNYTDGYAGTAPVMSYKPNSSGLYDMGGNVWEWVSDTWNAVSQERVKRGGSFAWLGSKALLASSRGHDPSDYRASTIGFRCVLEIPAGKP